MPIDLQFLCPFCSNTVTVYNRLAERVTFKGKLYRVECPMCTNPSKVIVFVPPTTLAVLNLFVECLN